MEWAPVLYRAGVAAAPHRVAHAYLELAVLVRALEGLTTAVRLGSAPDRPSPWGGSLARRSGPGSSICAKTCSTARSTISARLQPRLRLTVVGSANLDLVARVERLPRPGEALTDDSLGA